MTAATIDLGIAETLEEGEGAKAPKRPTRATERREWMREWGLI